MAHKTSDLRGQDIIDSRDVITRLAELQDTFDIQTDDVQNGTRDGVDDDVIDELNALKALDDEASGYSDWQHGATLIADSYFETYAEELASDIGAIPADAKWPLNHIDWEAAADELKQDYTAVEFDGITYWVR